MSDCKVIEIRKSQAERYQNLEAGVAIEDKILKFERKFLFNNKISILLPKSFTMLNSSIAQLKYPGKIPPEIIYSNQEASINFAFSKSDIIIPSHQMVQTIKCLQGELKASNPDYHFFDIGKVDREECVLYWFDFKTPGFDQDIYQLMYFTPIHERLLHGAFNCPQKEMKIWKLICQMVMASIYDEQSREFSEKPIMQQPY